MYEMYERCKVQFLIYNAKAPKHKINRNNIEHCSFGINDRLKSPFYMKLMQLVRTSITMEIYF